MPPISGKTRRIGASSGAHRRSITSEMIERVGIQDITALAGCGKIRTVRSAISQLIEEGRIVRNRRYAPTYSIAKEMAA